MGPDKFFFFDTTVDYKHFTSVQVIFLKKYFGSLENGCIFASAFDKKTGLLKKALGESERQLKLMRRKR